MPKQREGLATMRKLYVGAAAFAAILALEGCVTTPPGPTIRAMPGHGKSWDAFQADEDYCEHYASDRVAWRVNQANDEIARNTVIGTALGAALGGAIGGDTRGAVAGGVAGGALGAGTAGPGYKQYSAQRQYNIAYAQCMKYRGNEVGGPPPRYRDYGYPPPPPPPPGYDPDDE
jgi:hypothetical protein